jgi:hypothetical protein
MIVTCTNYENIILAGPVKRSPRARRSASLFHIPLLNLGGLGRSGGMGRSGGLDLGGLGLGGLGLGGLGRSGGLGLGGLGLGGGPGRGGGLGGRAGSFLDEMEEIDRLLGGLGMRSGRPRCPSHAYRRPQA